MQDEIKKVLETRKLNATSTLNIIAEKPEHHNVTLSLLVTHGQTHLGIHFHKHIPDAYKSVMGLSKLIPDEYVDVQWSNKNELEKLYKLTNLLEVALKAKLVEKEEETQALAVEKELPVDISDNGNIILSNKSYRKNLKHYLKRIKRDHWLGKNPFIPLRDIADRLLQDELNITLASIFPNESQTVIRKLFYDLVFLLHMNCSEMDCSELIFNLNHIMDNFTVEINQQTPVLRNFNIWPTKKANDMITASSRKMEKPSDELAKQGIPLSNYGQKKLCIWMTTVMAVMITLIILTKFLRSRKGAKGASKKGISGEEEGDEENLL
ncbi:uncharacterized protein [Erythrolamprus reginae]|uniref:uncharacterized protein n=1 Tax=Erythrolamprus reginae TaxID=121349 RepID=UPI00396CB9ED